MYNYTAKNGVCLANKMQEVKKPEKSFRTCKNCDMKVSLWSNANYKTTILRRKTCFPAFDCICFIHFIH